MILADDVKFAYDIKKGTKAKYDVNLETYAGLGLIDLYIYPHFQKANETMQEKTSEYERTHGIKICRLNDGDIISFSYSKNRNIL